MKRWLASFSFFALIFILTHAACAQECADTTGKQHHAPLTTTLKRGINISRWWEDSRDQFPTDQDFSLIVESGFDFIRLPVSPVWFTADNPQITQLHCDLVKLTSLGLRVIVDLHAHGAFKERQVDASEDEAVHNIMAVWERIAPALKDLPQDQILVETYNEPGIKTATWWSIQGQLVQQLRHLFPKNDIVATTGPVSGTWEYAHLTAYTDPHVYYDFHFYSPMVFTHHKAPWIDSFKPGQGYAPVVYPYDPSFEWDTSDEMVKQYAEEKWHKENMRKYADDITKWATQNHAHVLCLEFGVYRDGNDSQSRANWLKDTRTLMEEYHIPWAMWEYHGSFGFLDKTGHYDSSTASALGMRPVNEPQ